MGTVWQFVIKFEKDDDAVDFIYNLLYIFVNIIIIVIVFLFDLFADCNKVLRDTNNKHSRLPNSKPFRGCECMKGTFDAIVGILNGSQKYIDRVDCEDDEMNEMSLRARTKAKVNRCPCMNIKLKKLFAFDLVDY